MTAELIESLAKRKSRQVKEVRIDTCDVVESADEMPAERLVPATRRTWFDTRRAGKSAGGHEFVDALDAAEKTAVLEYLKTL